MICGMLHIDQQLSLFHSSPINHQTWHDLFYSIINQLIIQSASLQAKSNQCWGTAWSSWSSSLISTTSRKHLTNRWVVASRQCIAGGRTKAVADKDKGQSISGPRCNGDGPVTVQIWFVRQVQVVIENIFRSCGQLEKRDVWAIGFYDTGGWTPFPPDKTHSITLSAHPQRWLTLTMIASEITLRTSKKNWPHLGRGPKRLEASWWSAYIMKRV